jgi:probable HAF family extracellular repeat protein
LFLALPAAASPMFVGLGDLAGGAFSSEATGISADGSVVVGRGIGTSGNEAFRWTSGGGMVGLGDLPGGGIGSAAFDTSADGSAVVGYGNGASGTEAFRWTSGGGMVGLGDLAGGAFFSFANGVSADGSVVVGHGTNAASSSEAFRWTSGGGMVGLGDLAGGTFNSRAQGVSADGSVVVGFGTSASGSVAFIWDAVNGMRSLQDVLVNDYGLDLTGWLLGSAVGISADGTSIVGYGTHNGQTEAWLAVLPEPGTGVLVGVTGLLGLVGRRSRRA